MTQDVAAARVDFPTNDPTNPLHRLAKDIITGRIKDASISADVAYALARVAALEEGMDQARDLFTICTDPDQFSGVTTFEVYRKMREWCARHPRANPQDERGRE